jgi:hypothetical protein
MPSFFYQQHPLDFKLQAPSEIWAQAVQVIVE